jgi:hypothetical protein
MGWTWIAGGLVWSGALLFCGSLLGVWRCANRNRCAIYSKRDMRRWMERMEKDVAKRSHARPPKEGGSIP